MKIAIVLSTYNGEKYISEQLDSILNQTYQDFMLYIRDDGSKDSTISIIKKYEASHPAKITLIRDELGNLHVFNSYRQLLLQSAGDYFVFCDQDDIWDVKKLEIMKEVMNEKEKTNPNKGILLAHDYSVFKSEDSHTFIQSVHKTTKLTQKEIDNGLFQGFIAGCTSMFNKPAKNLFLKYTEIGIHDKHIVNLLNLFGNIYLLPNKLIQYRVHDGNTVGLKKTQKNGTLIKDLLKYFFKKEEYRKFILNEYFYMQDEMAKQIESGILKQNEYYSSSELDQMNTWSRKKWYLKHFKPFSSSFLEGIVSTLLI